MKVLGVALAVLAGLVLLGAVATAIAAAVIEARYPPNGRFVEVSGGRLHLVDLAPTDRAPLGTVLLLHGASGSSADPVMVLGRRLAERYRVIAVDRPGHGWSDRIGGAEAASPARQASVIWEALTRLGIERAIVVGHSWSGALATNMALDHADRVAGLVLLAPVSHPWPGGAVTWYYSPTASALGTFVTRVLTMPLGLAALRPAARAVFQPQEAPPDYVDAARAPLVLRPRTFRANAEDVAGLQAFVTEQSRRYGAIRAPTVIVSGDADRIVRADLHSRALERDIPGARLVLLPGVGHMPHFAAADRIAAEIDALATALAAVR
jgi:pimeloyl-ACP methyl ester carboxylesterase